MKIITGITKVELTRNEIETIKKAGQIFTNIYYSDEIALACDDDIVIGKATFKFFGVDDLATTLLSIVE